MFQKLGGKKKLKPHTALKKKKGNFAEKCLYPELFLVDQITKHIYLHDYEQRKLKN